MPKISALPPATRAGNDYEIPVHNTDEGETQKITVGMLVPAGVVEDYAGVNAPDGWLMCYGQTLNVVTNPEYADLYDAIGNTYGGTGNTDFVVPDARGRVIAGQDDMGGVSANRLTAIAESVEGDTLGAVGGVEKHKHHLGDTGWAKIDPVGAGPHNIRQVSSASEPWSRTVTFTGTAVSSAASGFTDAAGLGGYTEETSSVQPTIILNKIIKY